MNQWLFLNLYTTLIIPGMTASRRYILPNKKFHILKDPKISKSKGEHSQEDYLIML